MFVFLNTFPGSHVGVGVWVGGKVPFYVTFPERQGCAVQAVFRIGGDEVSVYRVLCKPLDPIFPRLYRYGSVSFEKLKRDGKHNSP